MTGDPDPLPPASEDPRTADLAALCAIMERLRRPADGCPWDLEQSLETLWPYLREELEEAAEAASKVEAGDLPPADLRSELGDLLFNVVFVAELCREKGWFTMADVVADKERANTCDYYSPASAGKERDEGEAGEARAKLEALFGSSAERKSSLADEATSFGKSGQSEAEQSRRRLEEAFGKKDE